VGDSPSAKHPLLVFLGGVGFGTGLDRGKEWETDSLSRLGRDDYDRLWDLHVDKLDATFKQELLVEVGGGKTVDQG